MRNCIPEETLQAWFDGELADNEAATVAAHLIECLNCAEEARTVEAENLIVSKGLAFEFEARKFPSRPKPSRVYPLPLRPSSTSSTADLLLSP